MLDQRRHPALAPADLGARARRRGAAAGADRAAARDGAGPAPRLRRAPCRRALAQLAGHGAPRHGRARGRQRSRPALADPVRSRPHRLRREGRGRDRGRRRLDRGQRGAGGVGPGLRADGGLHAAAPALRGGRGDLRALRGPRAAAAPGSRSRRASVPPLVAPRPRDRGARPGGRPPDAHRLLGAGASARHHDRAHPRRAAVLGADGRDADRLRLRPRRPCRRARPLVEAQLLRGFGRRPAPHAAARRAAGGGSAGARW